jgi:hypothetical protein
MWSKPNTSKVSGLHLRPRNALNQDMIVVVTAVHFQECVATRRNLVQTRTSRFAKLDLPDPGAPVIATTTRRDASSSAVDRTSSSNVTFRGIVEQTMDDITEFELRHRVVPRNRPPSPAAANVARGYFLTLSNSTRSVGVEDRKTMTAIRNRPQTAVERC